MKITESITRECCQPVDFRAVQGSPAMEDGQPQWTFCRHCGHRRVAKVYENAEWSYVADPPPWADRKGRPFGSNPASPPEEA